MENNRIESKTIRSQSGMVKMLVSFYDGEKLLEQTVMGLDDYISLLQGAVRRVDAPTSVMLGTVPRTLYDGFVTNEAGTLGGIFYLPPEKRQFVLAAVGDEARQSYYMPMPGLVYSLVCSKGNKRSMKCFAYKEWAGDDTVLYCYPFGNVSDEGSVCMGTVNRASDKMKTFVDLDEYIEDSLYGVTNSDYLRGNKVRLSTDATQHQFCDCYKDHEVFPNELLLEFERIPTVGALKRDLSKVSATL